jgi:TolA-binding protein
MPATVTADIRSVANDVLVSHIPTLSHQSQSREVTMSRQMLNRAALCALVCLWGTAAADSGEPETIQTAELSPRTTTPAMPVRPTRTAPAKSLAEVNQRLDDLQRQITKLKRQLNKLRSQRQAPASSGQSGDDMAAQAVTAAAEARDIALRAEQKADQALATAAQALGAAQSQ